MIELGNHFNNIIDEIEYHFFFDEVKIFANNIENHKQTYKELDQDIIKFYSSQKILTKYPYMVHFIRKMIFLLVFEIRCIK